MPCRSYRLNRTSPRPLICSCQHVSCSGGGTWWDKVTFGSTILACKTEAQHSSSGTGADLFQNQLTRMELAWQSALSCLQDATTCSCILEVDGTQLSKMRAGDARSTHSLPRFCTSRLEAELLCIEAGKRRRAHCTLGAVMATCCKSSQWERSLELFQAQFDLATLCLAELSMWPETGHCG